MLILTQYDLPFSLPRFEATLLLYFVPATHTERSTLDSQAKWYTVNKEEKMFIMIIRMIMI